MSLLHKNGRAHARDLALFDTVRDIQDERPLPMSGLEAVCRHR